MRRRFINNYDQHISTDINNYLTIEALEDGLTVSLSTNACEYCIDGDGNWKTIAINTATESINVGQTLSFRGNLTPVNYKGIGTFIISKKCNLKGNCMSMLFGGSGTFKKSLHDKSYAFYKLFYNCTNIINVSDNFLPATTLANNCYSNMFQGCSSLTIAPELPATTLANECYSGMFQRCSKLNYIKMLATDISASNCLSGWVSDVSSTGTFVKNPDMTTLPTGTNGIPEGWTVINNGEEN